MTEFRSRTHAQFQARIWREYATTKRGWAQHVMGLSHEYCIARSRAAVAWLCNNRGAQLATTYPRNARGQMQRSEATA